MSKLFFIRTDTWQFYCLISNRSKSLFHFRNGNKSDYGGGRTTDSIVEWINTNTSSTSKQAATPDATTTDDAAATEEPATPEAPAATVDFAS